MEIIKEFFASGDVWTIVIKVLLTAIFTGLLGLIGTLLGRIIARHKNSKIYKYADACVKAAEIKFPNEGTKMGPEKMQYVMDQMMIKFPKIRDNQYLYNMVVPVGGYDITRDIEQIGISLAYAEQLKCKYGYASADMVKTNHRFHIPAPELPEGEEVLLATELATIISSRLDQMLLPLLNDINKEAERYSVLYVTGGGAMLQGIVEYIQSKTPITVMYGSHAAWLTQDTPDEMCMPTYSSLVGTLLLGATYRATHPLVKETGKRIIDILTEKTLTIFTEQAGN